MNETKTRSASKSIIWRLMGVAILAAVTYAYTREWITTGLITFLHHAVFLVVFYYHERLWLKARRIQNLTSRSILKMLTYETLCGNVILGTISYLVTGSWKQMTAITLTYISIKHILYVFNEFAWDRIKIGLKIATGILILCGLSFADYWNVSAIRMGSFGADIEIRMTGNMYYKHIHFDWHYGLSRHLTLTFSERESYIKKAGWRVEHKPMINLTYKNGIFKNRARVTLRIREGMDIWRFRNKTTLTPSFWFIAFETFCEKGRWFRNRYYIGTNVSDCLGLFLMRQITRGDGIWVIGTKLMARF